jgi:uncharacterized Zn finger protein
MPIPNLTVATIQRHATDTSYTRGQEYARSGAVTSITQRQQTLQADVEGNAPLPYRVTLDFDGGGVTSAHCTCPYHYEGWCKHIVASLLTCVQQPEAIESRPTLAQLLDQLDWAQTQELVQSLVAETPELIESVDLYVTRLAQPASAPPSSPPQRQTKIDPTPFRRRAREILQGAVRDWEYGRDDDDIAYEMGDLMASAMAFIDQGDASNALVALEAITTGCIENWDVIDDFCGLTPQDVDLDFDAAWTEVLLSAELTDEAIAEWQAQLAIWQDSLGPFAMSLEALRQRWDYPPLVQVLAGERSEQRAWSGDAPDWADGFSQIRLKILARQERYEDYLQLAKAEGLTQPYLTMLAQLGRIDEVMAIAPHQMTTLSEAKAVAETVRSQNQLSQALQIALQGLRSDTSNPYATFDFAIWTSDLAEGMGDWEAALEARIIAFKARPSFADYQKIAALAEAQWPDVQATLLEHLRTTSDWGIEQAQIDVFLHEGLVEDAIAVASQLRSFYGDLVMRVMDTVSATHSQWVIENARPRAESIMDEGKAKYYYHAVQWLKRMKAAYQALGKPEEWQRYSQALRATHGRKYKLMGLMEQHHL